MHMFKKLTFRLAFFMTVLGLSAALPSCGGEDDEPVNPVVPEKPETPDEPLEPEPAPPPFQLPAGFAKGADVSWLTLQEAQGEMFYSKTGEAGDAMQILRDDCGVNAIRLRVWVNPADGYCNPADVLAKATRAKALRLPVMVDFHLSDSWADPGKQTPPAAWAGQLPQDMAQSVKSHVTETLTSLKKAGVDVKWVQVGNETPSGMLWESGRVKDQNAGSFPLYLNAGYDAVKAVYPDAQVIVHLDRGQDKALYKWFFNLITSKGGKFDMIGMSLYPEKGTWPEQTDETAVDNCIDNIKDVSKRYGKPVMLCEIGMHYTRGSEAARVITKIITSTVVISGNQSSSPLQGIFYWEPQASPGFNGGYNKGAFENGRHNGALAPFSRFRSE